MKGDAILKKMKRVSIDPISSYPVDDEARTRFKHQSLLQDYDELFKETEAIKKKLQRTKQKKLTLLAEVRFLRRRFKYLLKNRSSKTPQGAEIQDKIVSKERSYSEKEANLQSTFPVLDLNQISKEDESEEFQAVWEPLKMEKKPKKCLISRGDEQMNDINLSVYRGIGNGSNQTGKRKISWQDQVSLRV